jgi:hypothetical protein
MEWLSGRGSRGRRQGTDQGNRRDDAGESEPLAFAVSTGGDSVALAHDESYPPAAGDEDSEVSANRFGLRPPVDFEAIEGNSGRCDPSRALFALAGAAVSVLRRAEDCTVGRHGGRRAKRRSGLSDSERAQILAVAEELGIVGTFRVLDRLRRELGAEQLFAKRFGALSERAKNGIPASLLLELAGESCKQGYPTASVSPLEILESPSFRDYLGFLIAQRRSNYRSVGTWPERIARALFGKRDKRDGKPEILADAIFDQAKLGTYDSFHDGLQRAHKETLKTLTSRESIEADLRARGFKLTAPAAGTSAPPGYAEQQAASFNARHLPELAQELSEHRKAPKSLRVPLQQRAIKWALRSWAPEARYGPFSKWENRQSPSSDPGVDLDDAMKELNRLQQRKRRT